MSGKASVPSYSTFPPGLSLSNWSTTGAGGGEEGEREGFSAAEKGLIGTVLIIFIVMAVVGNSLVCIAVFTDRRLKRNSNNFFLVSLAMADLFVALMVMTFAIFNDVQGIWYFGAAFCKIWISSDIMCSTASILNLCVISVDRYIHIQNPLRYEAMMSMKKAVMVIAAVWILSALMSFVPLHLGWHELPNSENITKDETLCILELNPTYAVVSSSISFYIPCVIMLSTYVRLYIYAQRHVKTIRKTTVDQTSIRKGSIRSSYRDHKAAVTLGIIMGVFLMCWVPFFIINPIAAFCGTCITPLVFQVLTWLGYVNSCLNPIIYTIFNTEFRYAFRRILLPQFILRRTGTLSLHTITSTGTTRSPATKVSSTAQGTEADTSTVAQR